MTHWRLALADASPAWKVPLSKSGRNSLWWPKSCLSDCDPIADFRSRGMLQRWATDIRVLEEIRGAGVLLQPSWTLLLCFSIWGGP